VDATESGRACRIAFTAVIPFSYGNALPSFVRSLFHADYL
jgi:hypothetical protein